MNMLARLYHKAANNYKLHYLFVENKYKSKI